MIRISIKKKAVVLNIKKAEKKVEVDLKEIEKEPERTRKKTIRN